MAKKFFAYFILMCFIVTLLSGCSQEQQERDISDKLIRFHVIANSDSIEDQELKLKVRDKVLEKIGPKLETSSSKEETKEIINNSIELIKSAAIEEVNYNGKSYDVSVMLGKSTFPTKMYSSLVIPAGEYDALKIVIGSGEGKNWWCVMFPPLCFIDITRGVTSKETEEKLKSILNEEEYDALLLSSAENKKAEVMKKPIEGKNLDVPEAAGKAPEKVELKFKSVEAMKEIYEKVANIIKKK